MAPYLLSKTINMNSGSSYKLRWCMTSNKKIGKVLHLLGILCYLAYMQLGNRPFSGQHCEALGSRDVEKENVLCLMEASQLFVSKS